MLVVVGEVPTGVTLNGSGRSPVVLAGEVWAASLPVDAATRTGSPGPKGCLNPDLSLTVPDLAPEA